MSTINFNKLLLDTAFCCMASDGHIDNREVALIKKMCENSDVFQSFNIEEELNFRVAEINKDGKRFIGKYFDNLNNSILTEKDELILIDIAIQTIKADDQIEYAEIKFFKNIRHRLKISDENILAVFPDIEQLLEEDIINESFLDKITKQYLEAAELTQFELIRIDTSSLSDLKKDD